jgi:UDP-N-acetyl-D-mannosaminuronic acid dehydrogenase
MKKICVFGLGYIGLPTSCLFATNGYRLVGVDIQEEVVDRINKGQVPFEEPGLEDLLKKALSLNNLVANTAPEAADVFLIAVPTPLDDTIKTADLKYVRQAAKNISSHLDKGNLVVLESTVPPGTCNRMLVPILEESGLLAGKDFHLAYCPERAIPGKTISEMINNDKIIGGLDLESAEIAKEIYSSYVEGELFLTDLRTAEMVKLMENTYRDINIALANECAQIAEENGVNIWEAIELANRHPRVDILKPGPGVGGHCIAIDPQFLAESSTHSQIISLAREINNSMPRHILRLVKELVSGIGDATISVFGVAYKGDIDDTRETPALKFLKMAEYEGYRVRVYDPCVRAFEYELLPFRESLRDSDCLVLITDHSRFELIDPQEVSELMRNRNLVDTRNIVDHRKWQEAGFSTRVLGDGTHTADG